MSDLYTPLSVEDILDLMLRAINADLPLQRTGIGSQTRTEYEGIARAIADNHQYLDAIARNVTPESADIVGLELWSVAVDVPRKSGEPARKAQSLRVRGVSGAVIPNGSTLTHSSDIQYEVTTGAVVTPVGFVDVDLQATSAGEITRLSRGEQLLFDSTPTNVEPVAVLVRDLDEGGTDQESVGSWRVRILEVWKNKRQGGSRVDYALWALELPWVSRAYVYPRKPTIDSVGIVALKSGSSSAVLPTTTELTELREKYESERPIADTVVLFDVVLGRIDVEITLVLVPDSVADWTVPVGGLTVASYDAATAAVTTQETLPTDLQPGGLLTVASNSPATTGASGRPARVSAILGPNEFVIIPTDEAQSAALDFTPAINDPITPSSEAMLAVWRAVIDGVSDCAEFVVDGLGTLGPANPDRRYGPWLADARADAITAIANANPNVAASSALIDGSTNGVLISTEFSFPDDTTVELLQPGQIWVRT